MRQNAAKILMNIKLICIDNKLYFNQVFYEFMKIVYDKLIYYNASKPSLIILAKTNELINERIKK